MADPLPGLEDLLPAPKRRSSRKLGAAVALLLGLPLAGFAFKVIGPLLFNTDEALRPIVEITGPRGRAEPSGPPAEARRSSIGLVQGDLGAAPPAEAGTAAAPPSTTVAAQPPAAPERQPQPQAPPKAYPKLTPNHGWRSWFARQPQQPAPQETATIPATATTPATPTTTEKATTTDNGSPASPTAPETKAAKPARRGYRPPAVSYSASAQGTIVTGLPGGGTVDAQAAAAEPSPKRVWSEHSVFQGAADSPPEPNPEKARPDGNCPRAGWWKSPATALCYFTQGSCAAADTLHRACVRPNP